MQSSVKAPHCFRCGTRVFDGELIGLEEQDGRQIVFCCMCLDLKTSRLELMKGAGPGASDGKKGSYPSPLTSKTDRDVLDKFDLQIQDLPESLVERIDQVGKGLEETNPGVPISRTTCITILLMRALAVIEGQEELGRRKGRERRKTSRGPDRRQELRRWQDRVIQQVEKDVEAYLRAATD